MVRLQDGREATSAEKDEATPPTTPLMGTGSVKKHAAQLVAWVAGLMITQVNLWFGVSVILLAVAFGLADHFWKHLRPQKRGYRRLIAFVACSIAVWIAVSFGINAYQAPPPPAPKPPASVPKPPPDVFDAGLRWYSEKVKRPDGRVGIKLIRLGYRLENNSPDVLSMNSVQRLVVIEDKVSPDIQDDQEESSVAPGRWFMAADDPIEFGGKPADPSKPWHGRIDFVIRYRVAPDGPVFTFRANRSIIIVFNAQGDIIDIAEHTLPDLLGESNS